MKVTEGLRVSVIQTPLHWENVEANLAMFTMWVGKATPADIVVLPEMFTTGFSMHPGEFATESYSKGLEWMLATAKDKNTAITGSMMAHEDGKYYNRLLFVTPEGEVFQYDKRHLFSLGDEANHFTAGDKQLIVNYKGWKICPLICYDLRFPVWSRNTMGYDILIYVANWPTSRSEHWRSLLKARAIENQCFVVGCNRMGRDGNGLEHDGYSALIDYSGQVLEEVAQKPDVLFTIFTKDALDGYRQNFPFLADGDDFSFV